MILLWDAPHPLRRYVASKHLPRSVNQLDPTPQKLTDVHFPLQRQSRRSILKPECWAVPALYVIIVRSIHSQLIEFSLRRSLGSLSKKKTTTSRHQEMPVKLFTSRKQLTVSLHHAIYKPLKSVSPRNRGCAWRSDGGAMYVTISPYRQQPGTCNRQGHHT